MKWVQINSDATGMQIHDEETGAFVGYASWYPNAQGKVDEDWANKNAALMAAAPEMANMLRILLKRLDLEPVDAVFPNSAMRDDIRALLARAEGERNEHPFEQVAG